MAEPGAAAGPRPVEHVVLFSFKDGVTEEQVAEFFADIEELARTVPGIARLRHGANCSPEGLSRGLTHGFAMEFEGAAARDAYLPHPAHEAFKARHVPKLEEVLVVDF